MHQEPALAIAKGQTRRSIRMRRAARNVVIPAKAYVSDSGGELGGAHDYTAPPAMGFRRRDCATAASMIRRHVEPRRCAMVERSRWRPARLTVLDARVTFRLLTLML